MLGFLALVTCFASITHHQTRALIAPLGRAQNEAEAQRFLVYRNAVISFVGNNRDFFGTVQFAQLGLPPAITTASLPTGASNEVISDGAGGSYVYVWGQGSDSELEQIGSLSGGDVSIGITSNGQWSTPSLGVMGPIPSGVSAGYVFSANQIGN